MRDGDVGIETYLLVRNHLLEFAGGATVFPGGAVDDSDHHPEIFHTVPSEITEEALSRKIGLPPGGSGFWFAAVRECFEEVGVLLIDGNDAAPDPAQLHAYRGALLHDETSLVDACRSMGVSVDLGSLRYLAHWITPAPSPRRYDTRFFVAPLPVGQDPDPDRGELVSGRWWSPDEAQAAHDRGDLELILPTQRALAALGRFDRTSDLFDALDAAPVPPPMIDDHGGHLLEF